MPTANAAAGVRPSSPDCVYACPEVLNCCLSDEQFLLLCRWWFVATVYPIVMAQSSSAGKES